jgi:hypothetical protein
MPLSQLVKVCSSDALRGRYSRTRRLYLQAQEAAPAATRVQQDMLCCPARLKAAELEQVWGAPQTGTPNY